MTDPFGDDVPDPLVQDLGADGAWVPDRLDRTLARMHWEPRDSTRPTGGVRTQNHPHGAWTRQPGNFIGWALHPAEPDPTATSEEPAP